MKDESQKSAPRYAGCYMYLMMAPTIFLILYSAFISFMGIISRDLWIIPFMILSAGGIFALINLPVLNVKSWAKPLIFIATIVFFISSPSTPPVIHVFQAETCVDTGLCAEGIKAPMGDKVEKVTKENCLKNGKLWYEEDKICNIRKNNK